MTDVVEPESDQAAAPVVDPNAVQVTINGVPHTARKGQLVIDAAADAGEYIPRFCYHERMTPVGKCRMCLVESDSGRGPAVTVCVHGAGGARHEDRHRVADGQADAGGRARAAARQPPARLPGVRQGRRVPAAGPDVQPRSRREPLRRGEAPLREADPDQRPRVPRPRALHPVRSLHPVRRRGGRRCAHPLHRAAATTRRSPRSPTSRSPATSAATPCRSARWVRSPPSRTASRPARGTSSRSRARAPRARWVAAPWCSRSRDELLRYHGRRQRSGELGLAVRPRPLQLRVGEQRRAARAAARAHRRRSHRAPAGTPRSPAPPALISDAHRRRRAGQRRRHRRRPWHQRGRVRLGAPRATTSSARPTCTRRWATACRSACWACPEPPSTRLPSATTIVLLGPDLKEELPVLYLRLRDAAREAPQPHRRVHAQARRAHAVRVAAASATSRAPRRRRCSTRSPTPRSPSSWPRARSWSSPVGPTSPSRRAATVAGAAGAADRAAVGARCCRRSGAATWSARCRWHAPRHGRPRHPRRAAGRCRRQDRVPRAGRRRSARRLPRRRPGPPGARRCPSHRRRRHVPHPDHRRQADVVLPAAALRREERHHHQPRGSGHHGRPARSRPPAPADPTG